MNQKVVRIAHIAGKLAAGGVESVIFNYYKHIDHNRYQFDIYYDDDSTVEPPKELIEMGARFIKIPRYQHLLAYLKSLMYAFKKEKYQIVHSHMNTLSVFPLLAAWLAGVPVRIAHNHSTLANDEKKKTILKHVLRLFSKVFATHYAACTTLAGEALFGKNSIAKNKVHIINNAIETDTFAFDERERVTRRDALKLQDEVVVGHVGRFAYQKNHHFLIDVFSEFIQMQPEAKLLLVGDGPLMEQIKEYCLQKGVAEKIIFAGVQSNVSSFYQAMDILIFPSRFEGLGMAVVEAQASGMPVIASDAVPVDAVFSSNCVRMSLNESPVSWAKVANNLLAKNNSDRKSAGQIVAACGYEIKQAAASLVKYYDTLLTKKSKEKNNSKTD